MNDGNDLDRLRAIRAEVERLYEIRDRHGGLSTEERGRYDHLLAEEQQLLRERLGRLLRAEHPDDLGSG